MEVDFQYHMLFQKLKSRYSDARCGIFCNHTSFLWKDKKYLVRELERIVRLETIFIPEHGFFAELQDQQPLSIPNRYDFLETSAEMISLYHKTEYELMNVLNQLNLVDLLIIDIQDVGVRYFTYVSLLGRIFEMLKDRSTHILVIDHPNPAGRQIEGIPLPESYESLIGWPGLPHRYGLTLGELARFMKDKTSGKYSLEIIKCQDLDLNRILPYPSPNIPHPMTPLVYTGQCLWEGTNVSEGRGTTRPFEIFGAPFFKKFMTRWTDHWNEVHQEAILRPLIFLPTFHKYNGEYCYGFQLHPLKIGYHSLWYSLKLIREVRSDLNEFLWREGPYELGSDKTAIELLAGDETLVNFLNGKEEERIVREKLREEERIWQSKCNQYLLYDEKPRQIEI